MVINQISSLIERELLIGNTLQTIGFYFLIMMMVSIIFFQLSHSKKAEHQE